ncbi:hypothetical protein NE865_13298 [Phthorimaea operculella]|nr:hypothetical protein NE865_13298 [Phthorimaea operculella]
MALSKNVITLADLSTRQLPALDDEERPLLGRIVEAVSILYPDGWDNWTVCDLSREDVFGKKLDSATMSKLHFAIPTITLIKAFDPEAQSLSERMAAAAELLSGSITLKRKATSCPPTILSKKPKLEKEVATLKERSANIENMLRQLLQSQSCTGEESASDPEPEAISDEDEFVAPSIDDSLIEEGSTKENEDVKFDFSPMVKEADPLVPLAEANILKQGLDCQRFGQDGWAKLRYSEVQKRLHATPAFSALEVNSQLASKTPSYIPYEHLVKMDQALGTLTHGLLLQRKLLTEALKAIVKETNPSVAPILRKHFTEGSQFKTISDELLQYVCGRRAETIEARRKVYSPKGKHLYSALHKIPPSPTALFEEKALSQTLQDNGGFSKFFPFQSSVAKSKPIPNFEAKSQKSKFANSKVQPSKPQQSKRIERGPKKSKERPFSSSKKRSGERRDRSSY